MSGTVSIRVLCFSHVRHVLGRNELPLELPPGSTTDDALRAVRELANGQLDALPMRVARNRQYATEPEVLADGDEIALIPPVQGG
ncbi:MAG: MoaD/ThiS family protein [Planctomycetota bacterium]